MFLARELDTGWVAVTYCNWCLLSFSAICSSSFWRLPTCVFYPLWTKRPPGPFQSLETQPAPELPVGNRCINVPSTTGAQSEAHTPDLIRRKASEASTRDMSEALPIDRAVRLSTWNDCPCVKYTVLRIGGTCSRYRQPGQGIATGQRDYSASAEKANSEIAPSCPEDLGSPGTLRKGPCAPI